ncbi:MAG: phospholipase D family protein [bacterium]|nr:phospholipase D family protein [bacterium]
MDAIRLGRSEILVQAYNYTSPPILQALANAKAGGKVDVRVILDKSNEQERYTGATFTHNHGIPVLIDNKVAIAHSKVIIIDEIHVLTGSFNFTRSAQARNAENVILIKNDPAIAKRYRENWQSRAGVSRAFRRPR